MVVFTILSPTTSTSPELKRPFNQVHDALHINCKQGGKKGERKSNEGTKERRNEGTKERRNEGTNEGTKERRNEGTKERRNEGTKERRNEGTNDPTNQPPTTNFHSLIHSLPPPLPHSLIHSIIQHTSHSRALNQSHLMTLSVNQSSSVAFTGQTKCSLTQSVIYYSVQSLYKSFAWGKNIRRPFSKFCFLAVVIGRSPFVVVVALATYVAT